MARAETPAKNKKGSASKGKRSSSSTAAQKNLRANGSHVAAAQPQFEPLVDAGVSRDITGIVLAVVAVVSFIAVVSPSSAPVSHAIANFYHLGFGLGAYVLPFVILIIAALLFLRDRAPCNARICGGAALIALSILAMLSLMVPNTAFSTAGMFEPAALVRSGGYVGASIASALQQAFGKPISVVVLVGLVIVGLVIIGFSISDLVCGAAEHVTALRERRSVDLNETPWGEHVAVGAHRRGSQDAESPLEAGEGMRGGAAAHQGALFDDEGSTPTTFLGSRETTVLPGAFATEDANVDEDPFVDVSDQLEAETAQTTYIPIPDRHVAPQQGAQAKPVAVESSHNEEDLLEVPPFAANDSEDDASADDDAPGLVIPEFLKSAGASSGARSDGAGAASSQADAEQAVRRAARIGENEADDANASELQLPPLTMLRHNPHSASAASSDTELEQTAHSLQSTLQEFGLHSRVVGWIAGPTVTTFKVQPGEGERVSRISNLEDDIALSLAAQSVRIFAPIPGTSLVGIEIPNAKRQNVNLGDVLPYVQGGPLELAIGRDAEGQPVVADLAKMPHLLIAGTTGSGKSVMINSIIMALLMRSLPEDVRLIMVDPKRVELSGYNGLPHLYVPVVTEPKQAASALQWAVSEMERRLKVFERLGVRKISTFNEKQAAGAFEHYDNPPAKMPYLVIIIDELSDLMMVAGKDVEASIVRIAQLGRAAGIHLIVATQRPSSNVVTGLIKANITNRIAFNVATGIDSRVIIDQMGAEKLTGYGDMLFSKVDWGKPKRIQGCFVSDDEINDVVEFVKEQGAPDYHEEILSAVAPASMNGGGAGSFYNEAPSEDDPLLWDAAKIVVETQLGSTSGLQRRLKVGYARAGRIMDMLEEKGIVGPPDGSKPREVLYDEEGLAALRAVEEPLSDDEIFGGM